jgi:hypothetical protein
MDGRGRLRANGVVPFTWMQSLSLSPLRSSRKRGGRLGPGLAASQCHSTARQPQFTRRRPSQAPATRNRAPKLSTHRYDYLTMPIKPITGVCAAIGRPE